MSKNSLRIFLVDDEPSVLFALKLLLQAFGHQVSDFKSSARALEYLRSDKGHSFDVILCDLRMPEHDGFEVLREVKEIAPSLPFLLMSGHATSEEIHHATHLGAAGFLAKPFQPEEIKEMFVKVTSPQKEVRNSA